MRKLLNVLYVTNPDVYLSRDGENVVVEGDRGGSRPDSNPPVRKHSSIQLHWDESCTDGIMCRTESHCKFFDRTWKVPGNSAWSDFWKCTFASAAVQAN